MSRLNFGIWYVLENKNKWIDQSKIVNLNPLTALTTLFEVYGIFMLFFKPLDKIFQNQKLMDLFIQVFDFFLDPNLFNVMVTNFVQRGTEMSMLILTIPGSSCYEIGYKIGAVERLMFGIDYKM